MTVSLTVLVVGGYGVFGGRLVDLLLDEPRLTLVVAGRSVDKARKFCSTRNHAKARLLPARFDRRADLSAQLAALAPDVCVDASGPFQDYGAGRYHLIEACIRFRTAYLDLADGSEFVSGVSHFDTAAKSAGVFVLSGVSSFPVLTAAVVRELSSEMASVSSIRGGIAPSPYAGVGENVIRAIAGYAGQPVAVRRGGATLEAHPFTEQVFFTIAPPGLMPLRRTLFSLVDVPDLRALAELWPQAGDIWMGAGPVPELLHRMLIALAWLVRLRLVPTLSPLAPLILLVTNHVRWGEHRGGMFVEVEGTGLTGEKSKRSWHLLAEGDDGPLIPSMAIESIVRRVLTGRGPANGARAAIRELELGDYEHLFSRRKIHFGLRQDDPAPNDSLYARILGPAWDDLPLEIKDMHQSRGVHVVHGRCTVERGPNLLSKLVALCFRLPAHGVDVPVTVRFETGPDGVETWTRTFNGIAMRSKLREGRDDAARLLCESFGPFHFSQALVSGDEGLRLILRRWSVFGIPLPRCLGPRSSSRATAADGKYRFFVELSHPLMGLIVRYQGWLDAN